MLKHKNTIIGTSLLGLALGCNAVTLESVLGVAAIGRTLDLAIPVQMAEGDDVTSACLEADVFHGDVQQDPSRIHLFFEPGAQPLSGVVRLTSSSPVDEPVVTIHLRAGCSQKNSRRYVLLADMPGDVVAAPSSPMPTASTAAIASVPTVPAAIKTVSSNLPAVAAVAKPRASSPKARPFTGKNPLSSANPFATVVRKSSLKLDKLEPKLEPMTVMSAVPAAKKVSTPTTTNGTPAAPVTAASAASPSTSPEELLRQTSRAKAMEDAVHALKTINASNQRSLAALGDKVQKAEATGHSKWWVYALAALLAAAALALAMLLNPQLSLTLQRALSKDNGGR